MVREGESGAMTSRDLYERARRELVDRNFAAAFETFARSAQMQPHFKTCELAGECLIEMKRYADAVLYLAAAAGLAPKQSRCRFLLAKAFASMGNSRSEALAVVDECLALNPGYRVAIKLKETLESER